MGLYQINKVYTKKYNNLHIYEDEKHTAFARFDIHILTAVTDLKDVGLGHLRPHVGADIASLSYILLRTDNHVNGLVVDCLNLIVFDNNVAQRE